MEKGLITDYYRVQMSGYEILVSLSKAPQEQRPNTLIINTGERNPRDVLGAYRATYVLTRIESTTWGLIFAQMDPPPTDKQFQVTTAHATVMLLCEKIQQLHGEILKIIFPGEYKIYELNGTDVHTRVTKVQPLGQKN